jgi:hypothetical protein
MIKMRNASVCKLVIAPLLFLGFVLPAASKENSDNHLYLPGPCWHQGYATPSKPLSYRDTRTNILFYVESDGRHLAAIGPDGKLLWVRNPFEDGKLCPYRSPRPIIDSIKIIEHGISELSRQRNLHINSNDEYVGIQFDSSQFGLVDERTGYFTFMGQN